MGGFYWKPRSTTDTVERGERRKEEKEGEVEIDDDDEKEVFKFQVLLLD